jgi:CHAT domain-containing protein/tetratricopeptide (TPR) repeat protein
MRHRRHWPGKLWLLCIVIGIGGWTPLAARQTESPAFARSLTEKFFAAYQKEDLEGLMSLWSEKSPDYASSKRSFQQTFANYENIEVKNLVFLATVAATDEKTSVQLTIDVSARNSKTARPAEGLGRLNRTLQMTKEGEAWKIWRYFPSEENLATELIAAQTIEARKRLLDEKKNLVTAELTKQLSQKGRLLLEQGKSAQALNVAEFTLAIAESLNDSSAVANVLRLMGNIYRTQGDYERAFEYLQKSLKTAEAAANIPDTISALNNLSGLFFFQSKYDLAIEQSMKSLQLAEKTGQTGELFYITSNLSLIYKTQGDYTQALSYVVRSLKEAEAMGDNRLIIYAANTVGTIYQLLGDYARAQSYYLRSLRLAEESGDKKGISNVVNNLGILAKAQSDFPQALEYHRRGLQLARELGDKTNIANSLNNIGTLYHTQGNYAQALENYQQSLKLKEEIGDKAGLPSALNNIGQVYREQGNYTQALDYLQRSLKLKEELKDKPGIANTLNSIGIVYYFQDNYAQALEYFQKNLQLREETKDKRGLAGAIANIGLIYDARGEYARALEYYQRGLKIQEELGDRAGVANQLLNVAATHHAAGQFSLALETAERASTLASQLGLPQVLWSARNTAGMSHLALNQHDEARRDFLEAIATIEKLREQVAGGEQDQQRYFEDKLSPYYSMIELSIIEKDYAQALAYAERSRGRVLLDVLSNGRVNITKAMTTDEILRDRTLVAEVNSLNTQITRLKLQPNPDAARLNELKARLEKARLEYESFQTGLFASHPELKIQRGQTQPLTQEDAAGLLHDGKTALLEFVVAENKTYLFVMTKAAAQDKGRASSVSLSIYPLSIKNKELAGMAESFSRRVAERDLTIKQPARQLYDLLIKPAERQLQGIKKLCIVPDGPLWNLPFQALLQEEKGYLLEQYAIFYAPSLSVLREMERKGAQLRLAHRPNTNVPAQRRTLTKVSYTVSSPELFALGNPALNGEKTARAKSGLREEPLGPLPEAEKEVKTLGQLYGPGRSRVLIGEQALEATVKAEAGKYQVMHFATHAILDDRNPMYSKIILSNNADDAAEDGLLEAWEIMKLDLNAEMVVMSACQTARGRVGAGEGVIGMTWALFNAGVPSAVVSQWKVDSARTTELMVEFHKNLLRHRAGGSAVSKSEALREAALKLLRGPFNHPAYWAGFILIGDDN